MPYVRMYNIYMCVVYIDVPVRVPARFMALRLTQDAQPRGPEQKLCEQAAIYAEINADGVRRIVTDMCVWYLY